MQTFAPLARRVGDLRLSEEESAPFMAGARIRFVAVATTVVQLGVGLLALWVLWDTKVSSDRFSLEYAGVPLQYKPVALLVPVALIVLFGSAMVSALYWDRFRHARRLFTIFLSVAIAVVAGWWIMLGLSGNRDFFLATGALVPNEIIGASWPLFIIVALLSLAALLGLIPLACLVVRWLFGRARRTYN
jgi:hypothetical protein